MAGCSIVFLTILFAPALTIFTLVIAVIYVTSEFVKSIAFPFLVVGFVLNLLACADVARLLWRRWRLGEEAALEPRLFVRPAVLCGLACVSYLIMAVLAGSLVYQWYLSVN